MLKPWWLCDRHQRGTTLLEVLITIVILAFGLLGLAGLQAKVQSAELESYQRVQAILLLSDMSGRLSANRLQAAAYVAAAQPIGTGDAQPASCAALPIGPNRDLCEWSNALKGAGEQKSSMSIGAMVGARGCITQVQAPNSASDFCTPGIYRISVAWQGFNPTKASAFTCGQGLYGPDAYRRVITTQITVGLNSC
ncbi:MAG: type IV pilus modification protein PilV [Betaproteobacteria bacterium]|nr:type IV pilus modification protein PilV [Betaproteobacteria bacterium]